MSFAQVQAGPRGPSCVDKTPEKENSGCSFADLLKKLKCRGTYIGLMRQVDASVIFCENKILTADENVAVEKNIEVLKGCFPLNKVIGQGQERRQYLEDREILYQNLLPTWQRCKTALKNDTIIREPKIGFFEQKPDGKLNLSYQLCATHSTEYALFEVENFTVSIFARGINFCQLETRHVPSSTGSARQQSAGPSTRANSRAGRSAQ
jgi:hypothetical protein